MMNGVWGVIALAYHLLSRVAYTAGVGVALTRQRRVQAFTRGVGAEAGYRRFRRLASILMNNDAISFAVLTILTRATLPPYRLAMPQIVAGVVLVAVGVSIKVWAASRLGADAYYWHNFFVAGGTAPLDPPGPYRYLDDPMYTLGYLHAYGFALALGSWPGLAMAAFDQAAILVFHALVEKPHYEALVAARPASREP